MRPQPPGDNRWQRGNVVDALYLADREETLWAEWYRHLAERGVPPMQQLPRDLWRFDVPKLDVADLRDSAKLERVGLTPPTPGRGGWTAYQAVGEALWREQRLVGIIEAVTARPTSATPLFSRDGEGHSARAPRRNGAGPELDPIGPITRTQRCRGGARSGRTAQRLPRFAQ